MHIQNAEEIRDLLNKRIKNAYYFFVILTLVWIIIASIFTFFLLTDATYFPDKEIYMEEYSNKKSVIIKYSNFLFSILFIVIFLPVFLFNYYLAKRYRTIIDRLQEKDLIRVYQFTEKMSIFDQNKYQVPYIIEDNTIIFINFLKTSVIDINTISSMQCGPKIRTISSYAKRAIVRINTPDKKYFFILPSHSAILGLVSEVRKINPSINYIDR